MKSKTPKEKAFELMQLHGTNTPFVIQEVLENMQNLLAHIKVNGVYTKDISKNFEKFFTFWRNVNTFVMAELTANSIMFPEDHKPNIEDILNKQL